MKRWHWFVLAAAVLLLTGGGVAFALQRQSDPRWAKKLLGQSTTRTIGSSGCLLVVLTMAHNLFFKAGLLPDQANDRILAAGGFIGPNIKQDVAATALRMRTPGVTKLSELRFTALAQAASAALSAGGVVVVHVTYDDDMTGNHFILVTKKQADGGFEAFDPGFGTGQVSLDSILHGRSGTKRFVPVSVRPYFAA
jgi:hypothetical protein